MVTKSSRILKETCNRKPEGLTFIKEETPTQVFSCEYCEIFKNTYSEKHLRTAASGDPMNCTNYRAISLLSIFRRVCKK